MKHHIIVIAALSLLGAGSALAHNNTSTEQGTEISFVGGLIDAASASPAFSSGSLGLTVTGVSDGKALDVAQDFRGLGVQTSFFNLSDVNGTEYLTLSFNQTVTLNSLKLANWESLFDKATLSWGNQSIELSKSSSSNLLVDTFNLSGVTGTTFKLQSQGGLTAFRLNALSATPAVPEPATYALMGLGLVGIGALRRARTRG